MRYRPEALLLVLASSTAAACPLCAEAARQLVTIGMQLDVADRVVLAEPLPDRRRYRVVAIIKSNAPVGPLITEVVTERDGSSPIGGGPFLLIDEPLAHGWDSLGTLPVRDAAWLRKLTATYGVKGKHLQLSGPVVLGASFALTLSEAAWKERLALVLPHLESPDPLAAEIAWGELARAPYSTLDVAGSHIEAARVRIWLANPNLASRHAAYTLLLGFVGAPADATRLEQSLESSWRTHAVTNVSAMLAADLQLRGVARVDWVEAKYVADHGRTMEEIEAALLALHVHGDADGAIPRTRVLQAYRTFIAEHPPMAGFVAPIVADWNYWGAQPQLAALLKSNALTDPASRLAVESYLQRAEASSVALAR
jgi:hypothetical protein